jgi:hypothetical protein
MKIRNTINEIKILDDLFECPVFGFKNPMESSAIFNDKKTDCSILTHLDCNYKMSDIFQVPGVQ